MSRPVCKFYQRGRCEFGDRCWYDHVDAPSPRPIVKYNQESSPFHYYSKPKWTRDDIDQLLFLSRDAVRQVEKGRMWPLTCLSFLQMKECLSGWIDYSMEELRHGYYAAKKSGLLRQYQKDLAAAYSRAKTARDVLLKSDSHTEKILLDFLQSKETAVRHPGPSPEVFFKSYSFSNAHSFQTLDDPAPGLFARVTAQAISSGQSTSSMSSVNFGAVAPSRPDAAAAATVRGFPFASVPHTPAVEASKFTPTSLALERSSRRRIESPANGAIRIVPFAVHSRMQDLTTDELEQFKAATFSLGNIPTKPPPKHLC